MNRNKQHGPKKIVASTALALAVAVLTLLMALFGYHLASRYRDTIMEAVNELTDRIYSLEGDFLAEAEMSEAENKS